jgi:hypothetical protein
VLVDHLRWLERECLAPGSVTLRDLQSVFGTVGLTVSDWLMLVGLGLALLLADECRKAVVRHWRRSLTQR